MKLWDTQQDDLLRINGVNADYADNRKAQETKVAEKNQRVEELEKVVTELNT